MYIRRMLGRVGKNPLVILLFLIGVILAANIWNPDWVHGIIQLPFSRATLLRIFFLVFQTFILSVGILVCMTFTDFYNLKRKEIGITWCQFSILLLIGFWIIGIVFILGDKNLKAYSTAIGIIGGVLGWIFQDTIKGVFAFIYLRMNNLLHIGDWIEIPKHDVDGEISRVTLTHVTIYNWDTTTSSVPTSLLHAEHFKNLQKMMEGKTYGRRMLKSFMLDTGWFHLLNENEVKELSCNENITRYVLASEIREGMSNAELYREYLFHWLMNNPHISQQPRLIVRWMEQTEQGMPLQVYTFITDSGLAAFEWQQSLIIEHIMKSLDWFGLRLYQSPSSYDVSNSNIYLTDKPATYRKED